MVIAKRERTLLKKIFESQELLQSTLKELQISSPSDLNNIHAIMRRGLVQTVGDIFELTKELDESVLLNISLSRDIIKSFKNTASHRYENGLRFVFLRENMAEPVLSAFAAISESGINPYSHFPCYPSIIKMKLTGRCSLYQTKLWILFSLNILRG